MGMGMNHWEWEGMGLNKTFPLISTLKEHSAKVCYGSLLLVWPLLLFLVLLHQLFCITFSYTNKNIFEFKCPLVFLFTYLLT